MRAFVILVVSALLASCESMLWSESNLRYLYINDYELTNGEIEILLSEDHVLISNSIVGHHSSKRSVKRGYVYSSGRINLGSLLTHDNSKIIFNQVGEKKGDIQGLSLSPSYPNSILVDSYESCENYEGKCRRLNLGVKPKGREDQLLRVRLQESENLMHFEYQFSKASILMRFSRPYKLQKSGLRYDLLIVDK